jgi:hypothetical protein
MKRLAIAFGAALAAVVAIAEGETVLEGSFVHKGLTWSYTINGAVVKLIGCSGNNTVAFDAADIPWKFTVGETEYAVTAVGANTFQNYGKMVGALSIPDSVTSFADSSFLYNNITSLTISENVAKLPYAVFKNCKKVKSVIIPSSVTSIENQAFGWCDGMKGGIWLKGPSVASGKYCSLHTGAMNSVPPTVFLAGPMTKTASTTSKHELGYKSNPTKAFVPDNGKWTKTWKSDVTVFWYGKNKELDINIDEAAKTLTATVTTEQMLMNVVASAKHFKEYFNLDTVISVTNHIPASVTITEAMLKDVKLDVPTWYMTFAVKNQAQLDSLLAIFTGPLVIDISGASETINVPKGRRVALLVPEGADFKQAGLGLIFYLR